MIVAAFLPGEVIILRKLAEVESQKHLILNGQEQITTCHYIYLAEFSFTLFLEDCMLDSARYDEEAVPLTHALV